MSSDSAANFKTDDTQQRAHDLALAADALEGANETLRRFAQLARSVAADVLRLSSEVELERLARRELQQRIR